MNIETFFEKFDQFANAPNAVAKMRELVLQLAATGRLLPEVVERPISEDTRKMGSIVELVMGQAPKGDEYNTEKRGAIFVKVGEFGPLYPEKTVWTTNPLKFAKRGDVLVCVVGATVGKLNLAIDCAIGRSVAAIRPSASLDTKFLYYSLIPYTLRLRRNSRGSAQGVIGKTELKAVSLWVPSPAVQTQVVAKVDELMGLCDRLEGQLQERETRHAALARASLARFADAPTPANLDFLFHDSYTIEPADLSKSILTLAVQGKLVPQDSNDEPADSILRATEFLFENLVAAKKLSAPRPLPPIEEDEVSFSLPSGWAWCRLGQLMRISSGDGLTAKDMNDGLIPVYGGNGVTGYHDAHNVSKQTLVIGRVGFYCGSIHVTPENAWVTDNAFITTFDEKHMALGFVSWLLKATDLRERDNATAQPVISGGKIYPIVLGIPPLAEQRRIVAKVDQLMALVDQLEAQLAASRAVAANLMNAVVAELTAGA